MNDEMTLGRRKFAFTRTRLSSNGDAFGGTVKLCTAVFTAHAQLNYAQLNYAQLNYAQLNYAQLNYAQLNYAQLNYAQLN
jgi:uncharacterized protein YjbI with pentapeptide repeats